MKMLDMVVVAVVYKLKFRSVIDMTIDESIANEIEMAEGLKEQYECMMSCSEIFREQKKVFIEQCKHDFEEHEQLAEWLEELKALREKKCNKSVYLASKSIDKIDAVNKGYADGYNKALDDAKSVILQTLDNEILVDTLRLRLEQLKERTEK